jgi:hypothetical protein
MSRKKDEINLLNENNIQLIKQKIITEKEKEKILTSNLIKSKYTLNKSKEKFKEK